MKRFYIFLMLVALAAAGCSTADDGGPAIRPSQSDDKQGGTDDPREQGGDTQGEVPLPDADGDTIADIYEGYDITSGLEPTDTDGDGTPDYLDLDSDNDTIPDAVEARNGGSTRTRPAETGGCGGLPDFQCDDSDGNGIPDGIEAGPDKNNPIDTDDDTIPDYADLDNDGDTLPDAAEIRGLSIDGHPCRKCGEDWCAAGDTDHPWDSDGDTIPDYMTPDNDGDTIEDNFEGTWDTDGDGVCDLYDLDSDGDTVPDKEERGTAPDEPPADTDGDGVYDFKDTDSDDDGLPDADEVYCENLQKSARLFADTDGDNQSDMAETVFALQAGLDPADYVCHNDRDVNEFVDFYFELPGDGSEKTEDLTFTPQITKADVLLNIDRTGSMATAINNLKTYFADVVGSEIKKRVPDTNFGVSVFGDFDATPVWQLKMGISNNLEGITDWLGRINVSSSNTDHPEAGFEALYEIATGDTSKNGEAYSVTSKPSGIGGVGFRQASIPIIIHVTDADSHSGGQHATEQATYDALNKIGAKVVHLGIGGQPHENEMKAEGINIARATGAVVPVCAYKADSNTTWRCAKETCCTNNVNNGQANGRQRGTAPDDNNMCTLALTPGNDLALTFGPDDQNHVAYKVMLAVEALVKYGTYDVAVRVKGTPIPEADAITPGTDSSCFIQRVEAVSYTPPEDQPEHGCAPMVGTEPHDFGNAGYNNGFTRFAVGAAANVRDDQKSSLLFKVVAKNDGCVGKSKKVRTFESQIEVYEPVTGMIFDKRDVFIVVPAEKTEDMN